MDWTLIMAWAGVFLLGFVCGQAGMLAIMAMVSRIVPVEDVTDDPEAAEG
jgi:hypothetical protein